MARLIQSDPQTMGDAFPILLLGGLCMIVVMLIANLALRLHLKVRGGNSREDERDVLIDLLARRNGYWFATIGLSFVVVQAFRGVSNVGLAESALGAFLVAEVVRHASCVYFYRRGA